MQDPNKSQITVGLVLMATGCLLAVAGILYFASAQIYGVK